MLDCISVENMRLSDRQTIEKFVPSQELMWRAANGVFQAAKWRGRVAIMAGSGNNGGDGFALACILHSQNIECIVFTLSQQLSPDSEFYAKKAEDLGVPVQSYCPGQGCLDGYHMVVDCLLGTGFRGTLRDNYRSAIVEMNAANAYVVSVDINSGMNGDTGVADIAVISDLTVTIGYVKNGLITAHAGSYMKHLICADIGIKLLKEENKVCDEQEWQNLCGSACVAVQQKQVSLSGVTYYRCPNWLDMSVIRVDSDCL